MTASEAIEICRLKAEELNYPWASETAVATRRRVWPFPPFWRVVTYVQPNNFTLKMVVDERSRNRRWPFQFRCRGSDLRLSVLVRRVTVPLSRFASRVGGGSAFFVRHRPRTMNTFAKVSLAAATVALVSGCVHPLMCKRDAIDASDRTAEVSGYHLADYQHPKAEFFHYPHPVSQKPVQEWVVSYTPKVEMWTTNAHGEHWVTNFLSISVDCKTGATKLNKTDWEPD